MSDGVASPPGPHLETAQLIPVEPP